MSDKAIQEQINEINRKLDLLLEASSVQRQNQEAVNDLIDDVAIIGKDAFKTMVVDLDNAGVELDYDAVSSLLIRLIRNVENMGMLLETVESLNDLMKDLTPVVRQVGLDGIQKFHELEQKGYFEIISQLATTSDRILSRYSKEDLMKLSDNLIPVADALFNLADRRFLEKLNAITIALGEIKTEEIEQYSIWRLMRELKKPQVKKSLGFIMAFLTKINEQNIKKTD
jgi:uncharacterized protein YjgD (DUF1641 family)